MTKTILIVDDSLVTYHELIQMLEHTEFDVTGYCNTGEEAVKTYAALKPDIVLMDFILPGIDGLEASRQILAQDPDARIIMGSSMAYEQTEEKCLELGIKSFVYKPWSKKTLVQALLEVI